MEGIIKMAGFTDIILQAGYYFAVMLITVFIIALFLKGFFVPYLKVRLSFGQLVMVKIRAVNRDYYRVGRIDENDLVYKASKYDEKRINILDNTVFYRSLSVAWIDVEEQTNNIILPDSTIVPGFDAVKYNNLFVRALTRPGLDDQKDKIIMGAIILMIILVAVIGFMIYRQGTQIEALAGAVRSIASKPVLGG